MSDPADGRRAALAAALLILLHLPAGAQHSGPSHPVLLPLPIESSFPRQFREAAAALADHPAAALADRPAAALADRPAAADTAPPAGQESLRIFSTKPLRRKKSPWTAVGLSAVLPGAGQVYTENYWKVPVIWGLAGYWIYERSRNAERYREFRDRYSGSIAASPPFGDERLLRLREFYKDQRDAFSWYLGILYFLNVVDAFVGAELYDFDVGPDLGPGPATGAGVALRVRF